MERGHHGRALLRFGFYRAAGDAGRGDQESPHGHRAHLRGKGGKIEKTEHWGTRKLAYRVAKHREGIYVHQEIRTTHGELIAELERRLRVQDPVIKYQTVRLDEDLKRQKKLSQKREKRAARRPRRTPAPAPAAAAPEQAAASS